MCDPPGEKFYGTSDLGSEFGDHGDDDDDMHDGDDEYYGTSVLGSEYIVEDEYDPETVQSMIEDVILDDKRPVAVLQPKLRQEVVPEEEEDRVDSCSGGDHYQETVPDMGSPSYLGNRLDQKFPAMTDAPTQKTWPSLAGRGYNTPHPVVENNKQLEFNIDQPLARVKTQEIVPSPTSNTSRTSSSRSSNEILPKDFNNMSSKRQSYISTSVDFLNDQKGSSLVNLPIVEAEDASSSTGISFENDRRKEYHNSKSPKTPSMEFSDEQLESSILRLPIIHAVFASNSCLTLSTLADVEPGAGIPVTEPQHDEPTLKTSIGNSKRFAGNVDAQFVRVVLERLRRDEGFPFGLGLDFIKATKCFFPLRLWLIDNNHVSTRDTELKQTLEVQIQLAKLLELSSILCMVNGVSYEDPTDYSFAIMAPQRSEVAAQSGAQPQKISRDVKAAVKKLLKKSQNVPVTKLLEWGPLVEDVKRRIKKVEAELLWHGQRVLLVIATDHLPVHEESFCQAFESLKRLPIEIIARAIGTHRDDEALAYYRNAIEELELPIRLLGDFEDHERRVYSVNPWLNYARPLHVSRETGYEPRVFKLLDVRKLDRDELREFLVRLFGRVAMVRAPDIYTQWSSFFSFLIKLNNSNGRHRRKLTGKLEPWIDMETLNEFYHSEDDVSSLIPVTLDAGMRIEI